MAERTDFAAGVVVGALIGLGLGLLLAPQSGRQTRDQLRGKADEMSGRLREGAQDVSERVRTRARESAGEIATKVKGTLDETTQRLRGAYERGREAMQQKRQDILESLEKNEEI